MAAPARENLSSQSKSRGGRRPFAHGTFRDVCMAVYTNGPRNGQECVWKWFRSGHVYEADFYRYDIKAVDKAIDIVARFNKARVVDKPIQVNRAEVWTGSEGSDIEGRRYLVEPFIKHWEKWNSNTGWTAQDDGWNEVMQALSHFSYHTLGGHLVLCDLQGGLLKNGAVISDPVIMSRTRAYGVTDLGADGIDNFFAKHECNEYCRAEWSIPKHCRHLFDAQQGSLLMEMPRHAPTMHGRSAMTYNQNRDRGYDDDDDDDRYS